MSLFYKDRDGKIHKISGHLVQRFNSRWFMCTRSMEDGQEYYDISEQDTLDYFTDISPFTIYSFGFREPNETTTPKLRYKNLEYNILDLTSSEPQSVQLGQLKGVFNMFTQDLDSTRTIYFIGDLHKDFGVLKATAKSELGDQNLVPEADVKVVKTVEGSTFDFTFKNLKGKIALNYSKNIDTKYEDNTEVDLDYNSFNRIPEIGDSIYVLCENRYLTLFVIKSVSENNVKAIVVHSSDLQGPKGNPGSDANTKIDIIQVNGVTQDITDKTVNIIMPTKLADLSDDATHKLVSDTEKARWNDTYTKQIIDDAIDDLDRDFTELNGRLTETVADVEANTTNITTNKNSIDSINEKIPTNADSVNKLATESFVNSSINNFAAYYITKNAKGDAFNTKKELVEAATYYSGGVIRVPTRNDYCTVLSDESQTLDELGNYPTTRYSYQNGQWELSFIVNNTTFTQTQLDALNSNITSDLVILINTNKSNIAEVKKTADASMPKAGGQFTGPVSWSDASLSSKSDPDYFLAIEPFANGGQTKYVSLVNTKKRLGIDVLETMLGGTQEQLNNVQDSLKGYLPLTGGKLTGKLQSNANIRTEDNDGHGAMMSPTDGISATRINLARPNHMEYNAIQFAVLGTSMDASVALDVGDIQYRTADEIKKDLGLNSLATKEYVDSKIAMPIGSIFHSTRKLSDDPRYHLADGSTINASGIYADFYNYVKAHQSEFPTCTQTQYNTDVTNTGQCGKYVVNSTSIVLPKITAYIEGTSTASEQGSAIQAALPNITGRIQNNSSASGDQFLTDSENLSQSGALYVSSWASNKASIQNTSSQRMTNDISFDASRSNSLYGKSDTVQTNAIKYYVYIVTATGVNYDDVQVNVNNVINDINSKLDTSALLDKIYPVGSIYLSINNVSPASFIGGTWTPLPNNQALWLVTSGAGSSISAGLPNITGNLNFYAYDLANNKSGCFSSSWRWGSGAGGSGNDAGKIEFNASNSNSIYGNSNTVQPPAYKVYGWRRTE